MTAAAIPSAMRARSVGPTVAPRPSRGVDHPPPSDAARGYVLAGLAIVGAFFGGLGTWALTAPLNSAVVAQGIVKVEGNRKSVQHLEGGVVKAINVKEGSTVKAGDILIVLDDSQARTEYEVYT